MSSNILKNKKGKEANYFYIRPLVRYAFARKVWYSTLTTGYNYNNKRISLSAGQYISQFNTNNPVSYNRNTRASLLFEQNFAKIYEKRFAKLNFSWRRLGDVLTVSGGVEYSQRNSLENFEDAKPFINWKGIEFSPNAPINIELQNTAFPINNALFLDVSLRLKPWQRYRLYNGQKRYYGDKSPLFTVNYRKGLGDVDFDFLEANINHSVDLGIRTNLAYSVGAGSFLNNQKLYFPDFKHFMGNQFYFLTGDILNTFRLMDYYLYSTQNRFIEAHGLIKFRKLWITQIPVVRIAGISENLFVHHLATPTLKNYSEIGYGLDGLIPGYPFFRIEVIANFLDFKYQSAGFRVGTSLRFWN